MPNNLIADVHPLGVLAQGWWTPVTGYTTCAQRSVHPIQRIRIITSLLRAAAVSVFEYIDLMVSVWVRIIARTESI